MEAEEQLRRAPKRSHSATEAVLAGLRKSAGCSSRGDRPLGHNSSLLATWLPLRRKPPDPAAASTQRNIAGTVCVLIAEAVGDDRLAATCRETTAGCYSCLTHAHSWSTPTESEKKKSTPNIAPTKRCTAFKVYKY